MIWLSEIASTKNVPTLAEKLLGVVPPSNTAQLPANKSPVQRPVFGAVPSVSLTFCVAQFASEPATGKQSTIVPLFELV